jgi:hypothetical protein
MKFETHYAGMLNNHYEETFKQGLKRLWWIDKMQREGLTIQDIQINKSLGDFYSYGFRINRLHDEIRENILNCPDEKTFAKYFHYLVKIEWTLKEFTNRNRKHTEHLRELKDYEEWPYYSFGTSSDKYNSEDEIFGHCNYLLSAPSVEGIQIHFIIAEEFRYDPNKWKEHIAKKKLVPSLNDCENFLNKGINKPEAQNLIEDSKKEKDKLTHKQQVILLERLGVFQSELLNSLTIEQKGKLFSHLLNRDEKNTTEYIRNLNMPKKSVSKDVYFVKTDENIKKVSQLVKELGLE